LFEKKFKPDLLPVCADCRSTSLEERPSATQLSREKRHLNNFVRSFVAHKHLWAALRKYRTDQSRRRLVDHTVTQLWHVINKAKGPSNVPAAPPIKYGLGYDPEP